MKKFYNNTLISGAFSKALRVIALLCVLFGLSGNAWGATITGGTTLYLDASGGGWNSDGVRFAAYVCNGSSPAKWYSMYLVEGTIYKFTVENVAPEINASDISIVQGTTFEELKGVTAKDNEDGDLTFTIGKYRNKKTNDICISDPRYIKWIFESDFSELTKLAHS